MIQQKMSLSLHSIVTSVKKSGKVYQLHLVKGNKKAVGEDFLEQLLHYGKANIRTLLKEQTGKECFTSTAAQSVKDGSVMMTFQKKRVNVQSALRAV
ncbi:MAG: hypothetical protein VR72_13985 [Clostridiaceae bacterium BRH_c20a]|nr:MAG: hypothetical protein VR72_13985 [Clostridiaceae bacterium BRH_c20a]